MNSPAKRNPGPRRATRTPAKGRLRVKWCNDQWLTYLLEGELVGLLPTPLRSDPRITEELIPEIVGEFVARHGTTVREGTVYDIPENTPAEASRTCDVLRPALVRFARVRGLDIVERSSDRGW
jgi:hypothetical protein